MEEWEKRYLHDKCVNDALILCGNKKPEGEEKYGTILQCKVRVFKGNIYWAHMEKNGHDKGVYEECKCSRK